MYRRLIFTAITCLIACLNPVVAESLNLYVAPSGQIKAPGTIEQPLNSLSAARNKVRSLKSRHPNTPINVYFSEGDYALSETVAFWKTDGGSKNAPITYQNRPGHKVRFFGGVTLLPSQFKPLLNQTFINQLVDKSVAEDIRVIDLKALGITNFSEPSRMGWSIHKPAPGTPPMSLIINDKRMPLARWPNVDAENPHMIYKHYLREDRPLRGYEKKIQGIIDKTRLPGDTSYLSVIDAGDEAKHKPFGKGGTFKVGFDRMKYWNTPEKVFIDGVLSSTWEWTYNQVASVNSKEKTITLKYPEINGLGVGESVRLPHFYFTNIAEELDQAGEYYIDSQKGLLYLVTDNTFNNNKITLVTLDQPMVTIQNTQYITFDGIEFEVGRDSGIIVKNSHNTMIKNSKIAHFSLGGVSVDGTNNHIVNNQIYGVGSFGVHLMGGNKKTLSPANNTAFNNHIYDMGWREKSQQPGVLVDGVGQYIVNNNIHDGTHFAIRVRNANDVVISGNEIHHLPSYHHFDGGSLYVFSGLQPQHRGIVIKENYFHDIPTIGVYPDNYTTGVEITKNVFNRVGLKANRSAVMINGGSGNKTHNNLIVDSVEAYIQGIQPKHKFYITAWNKTKTRFGGNKVKRTPYAKYPEFIKWLTYDTEQLLFRGPSYFHNNIVYNPTTPLSPRAKNQGVVNNAKSLVFSDNAILKRSDVELKTPFSLSDVPRLTSLKPGFEPININNIGRKQY